MDSDALTVMRQAWDAWVAQDVEGFMALWDADGRWTMPGGSKVSGTYSKDEIPGMIEIVFGTSNGTFVATPTELAPFDDMTAFGYFHMTGQRDGAGIDQDGLQRMTVRDGKITSLWCLWADQAQWDEFFE
jgi:uncharacterized protein